MTTIVLNAEAVALLFPEGSESRLKLAHNVTDILVKSLALKQTKELSEEVKRNVERISQDTLRQLGIGVDWRDSVQIADHVKEAIRAHAQKQVQVLLVDGIEAALGKRESLIDERMANIDAIIQRRVDVLVDAKLQDMVRKAMRDLLSRT